MTLLMVTPMAVMMILMMPKMYTHVKTNLIIISASVLFFVLALTGLRKQVFISDVQYMKAMIPHHSSAILTSESAKIQNPKVRKLADDIIKAQKQEIAEMKSLLEEIE